MGNNDVTPDEFVRKMRQSIAENAVRKIESEYPDLKLSEEVEACVRDAEKFLSKGFAILDEMALEMIEQNGGLMKIGENGEMTQYVDESFNVEEAYSKLLGYIADADERISKAGNRLKMSSGRFVNVSDSSVKQVCEWVDTNVHSANKAINNMIDAGIWLSESNNPKYSTAKYREGYLELTEKARKLYVICDALLNIFYDHSKSKRTVSVPATKLAYGEPLMTGASGETETKPPFITKSMFDTGKLACNSQ